MELRGIRSDFSKIQVFKLGTPSNLKALDSLRLYNTLHILVNNLNNASDYISNYEQLCYVPCSLSSAGFCSVIFSM